MTQSAGRDEAVPSGKELEVVLAEMENRLRSTIVRVLRPALEQVSDIDHRMRDLNAQVETNRLILANVDFLRDEITEVKTFTKVLEEDLQKLDKQVWSHERLAADAIAEVKIMATEQGTIIQENRNDIQRLTREDARTWEECKRLQQQHDETLHKTNLDILGCHRRTDNAREELQDIIVNLGSQFRELKDDLFADGKGLTLANSEIRLLKESVGPLPDLERSLTKNTADLRRIEDTQNEIAEEFDKNQVIFNNFITDQAAAQKEMQSHFKVQCNKLVGHHAELMKEIRGDYEHEVDAIKETRIEISRTLTTSERTCQALEEKFVCESRRIDALHRELSQDIDELHSKRKKDRLASDQAHLEMHTSFQDEQKKSQTLCQNIDFLSRLFGLLLEGTRVACALQIQDFADRCSERWVCLPNDKPEGPHPPLKPQELEKARQHRQDVGFKDTKEIIQDLRRGLARCGYQPGSIPFGGSSFDRRDLLILFNRLLGKAHGAFVEGPIAKSVDQQALAKRHSPSPKPAKARRRHADHADDPEEGDVEVAVQPSARGGSSAEPDQSRDWKTAKGYPAAASPGKDGGDSWPPHMGSSGHGASDRFVRQRPGSQGQPQAVGSRGNALGSLGETEPPPGVDGFKLPAIGAKALAQTVPGKGQRFSRPGGSLTAR
eukprot:CAMPEP_0115050612 /NCGR_PEP_ID=MMETSP0227-20121206/1878_1 /TAXON_ID=89957 /ORGANISM="Polarella glacialis, Strain CCMP 1383" /LENGTH=662 /DNA_ID=CAMNT_0002434481 /DNA_START=127 /DNA_END=2115 /DNA_ORIENTATION=-